MNDEQKIPASISHSGVLAIATKLLNEFPPIAQDLIASSHDLTLPHNRLFHDNPDDPNQHKPEWHQWGIITHSLKFAEYNSFRTPLHLESWGIQEPIQQHFAVPIADIEKKQLFYLAILAHDLGKFTVRNQRRKRDGNLTYNYLGHEKDSGRIIRDNLSDMFRRSGLTSEHIKYIARCAELHYELGMVRHYAKQRNDFTIEFASSPEAQTTYQQIIQHYPEFAVEIGVLYIGDSLAKVEIHPKPIQQNMERQEVIAKLQEKGLRSSLADSALQLPVNLAVARAYLAKALQHNL